MTKRKNKRFTAFLWHRRVGLLALALVIILAITGIMLNHTERFKLDETYVSSSWLLGWYGIEPVDKPISFRVSNKDNDHIISAWEHQLFFDDTAITTLQQTMHGAIAAEQFIVIALDNEIILLSYEGEFIERVSTSISFSNIQRLGIKYKRPVIETSEPLYYMADEHILDLHSGRIFGQYGVYLMDAAAIALLWLSFSGLWVWNSRRHKMRKKKHYQKHHRDEL